MPAATYAQCQQMAQKIAQTADETFRREQQDAEAAITRLLTQATAKAAAATAAAVAVTSNPLTLLAAPAAIHEAAKAAGDVSAANKRAAALRAKITGLSMRLTIVKMAITTVLAGGYASGEHTQERMQELSQRWSGIATQVYRLRDDVAKRAPATFRASQAAPAYNEALPAQRTALGDLAALSAAAENSLGNIGIMQGAIYDSVVTTFKLTQAKCGYVRSGDLVFMVGSSTAAEAMGRCAEWLIKNSGDGSDWSGVAAQLASQTTYVMDNSGGLGQGGKWPKPGERGRASGDQEVGDGAGLKTSGWRGNVEAKGSGFAL